MQDQVSSLKNLQGQAFPIHIVYYPCFSLHYVITTHNNHFVIKQLYILSINHLLYGEFHHEIANLV